MLTTRVVRAGLVAPAVAHLQLAKPAGFSYRTGEFARLGLRVRGEEVCRAYSIASLPSEDTVDFFIANVKGGQLSPRMNALKAGDEVLIDPEAGGMLLADRLAPGGKHLWLFASGTGIAPFMGIIRDEAITRAYERIILVHGVRTWDETEYASRMITPQDKLIKLCSVTRVKDAAVTERIPSALASGKLEELAGVKISKADSRVMLCGNPALVKAVREHMKGLGIASPRGGQPGELLAENFWL